MKAIQSSVLVLIVLGMVACGGKSSTEEERLGGGGDDTDQGSDGGASTEGEQTGDQGETVSDDDPTDETEAETETYSDGTDTATEEEETDFAEDCADDGDEDCPCYPNGTCNADLICVTGRCMEAEAVQEIEIEDIDCSVDDTGSYGCDCYPNDTCNASLECVNGTCLSPDLEVLVTDEEEEETDEEEEETDEEEEETDEEETDEEETEGSESDAEETAEGESDSEETDLIETDEEETEGPIRPTPEPGPGPTPIPPDGGGPPIVIPDLEGNEIDEDCVVEYQTISRDWCDLGLSCESGYAWSSCYNEGDGLYCNCDANAGTLSIQLAGGTSLADACPYTAALCMQGTSPEFTGEPVCEPAWESSGSNYCEQEFQCTQTADLGNGVTAEINQYRYSSCQAQGGDTWMCYCYGNGGNTQFDMTTTASGSSVCDQATDICGEASSAEPSGPVTCEPSYQSAGSGYCSAEMSCNQSAQVGDIEVALYGSLWTDCEQVDDGLFECRCSSGTGDTNFELESDTSAWDTCTEALQYCVDTVGVEIGNGGGGGGIGPIPVPIDF